MGFLCISPAQHPHLVMRLVIEELYWYRVSFHSLWWKKKNRCCAVVYENLYVQRWTKVQNLEYFFIFHNVKPVCCLFANLNKKNSQIFSVLSDFLRALYLWMKGPNMNHTMENYKLECIVGFSSMEQYGNVVYLFTFTKFLACCRTGI